MNIFEKSVRQGHEANLKYLDGEFQVLSPGEYVRCAVTNQPIPLDELRYWSVDLQEAYASAEISFERYAQLRKKN